MAVDAAPFTAVDKVYMMTKRDKKCNVVISRIVPAIRILRFQPSDIRHPTSALLIRAGKLDSCVPLFGEQRLQRNTHQSIEHISLCGTTVCTVRLVLVVPP